MQSATNLLPVPRKRSRMCFFIYFNRCALKQILTPRPSPIKGGESYYSHTVKTTREGENATWGAQTPWCIPAAVGGRLAFKYLLHNTRVSKSLAIHHIQTPPYFKHKCFFFFQSPTDQSSKSTLKKKLQSQPAHVFSFVGCHLCRNRV